MNAAGKPAEPSANEAAPPKIENPGRRRRLLAPARGTPKRPCMYTNLGLYIDGEWINGAGRGART